MDEHPYHLRYHVHGQSVDHALHGHLCNTQRAAMAHYYGMLSNATLQLVLIRAAVPCDANFIHMRT